MGVRITTNSEVGEQQNKNVNGTQQNGGVEKHHRSLCRFISRRRDPNAERNERSPLIRLDPVGDDSLVGGGYEQFVLCLPLLCFVKRVRLHHALSPFEHHVPLASR